MSRRLTAVVAVEMKVLVHVGSWEANTTFAALEEQAQREARNSLNHHLRNTNIRVLGDAGAMQVTVREA